MQDVEPAAPFLFSLRKEGIFIYTMHQLGVEIPGPFPPPSGVLFWEAYAGKIPAETLPAAVIPWGDITEISSSGWGEKFTLGRKVALKNDGGREKSLDQLKVCLAAGIGRFRWESDWYEIKRDAMLFFFDPMRRINAPALSKPRPGW